MERVLVPNGSFHDIPLIRELKRMGYYVVTSGAGPDQIGHKYADKYVYGDFSDKELMLRIAEDERIDRICSNCNDFGYLSACYVAERMGLPGHDAYETALTLLHKDRFKRWAGEVGLLTPRAEGFSGQAEAEEYLRTAEYPVIVKPVDLGAGQGIARAGFYEEAVAAVSDAMGRSKAGKIVIEPFVEGTSHSFNAFVIDRKVAACYSDNEYMRYDRYRVSTSASPATGIEKVEQLLVEQSELTAEKLGLTDGLVHTQYIMDAEGKPHILEITRRMSGDWYPYPESRATGVDWVHHIVCAELGLDCSGIRQAGRQSKFTGRHCLNGPRPGTVVGVEFADGLREHIYDEVLWLDGGFEIRNVKKDYPGIIFFEFDDRDEMLEVVENIDDYVKLNYK